MQWDGTCNIQTRNIVFQAIWTHENMTERHVCCTCHTANRCLVIPPLSKALSDSSLIPQYLQPVAGRVAEAAAEKELKQC